VIGAVFVQKNNIGETWRAALYARLSREDGDKSESDSIVHQKDLIRQFRGFRLSEISRKQEQANR